MYKLALFDMDGTLLDGRTIFYLAETFGFVDELDYFINSTMEPFEKTIEIAKLLKDVKKDEILSCYRQIPFRPGVEKLIKSLREKDIILAIATDSYDLVANDVKQRLGFDFAFANNLLFHDSICTGDVVLHNSTKLKDETTNKIYSISKSTVLKNLCQKHQINLSESIAVGDGLVDCGMLAMSGLGVAVFTSDRVKRCADISTDDLLDIISYIDW